MIEKRFYYITVRCGYHVNENVKKNDYMKEQVAEAIKLRLKWLLDLTNEELLMHCKEEIKYES